jgi:hypothetical protein
MADHGPQQQQHQQQQPDAEEHAAAYQASDGDGLPEVEEQLAPSPQLRPVTFLQAGPGPGAGSEAPSFLGLGRVSRRGGLSAATTAARCPHSSLNGGHNMHLPVLLSNAVHAQRRLTMQPGVVSGWAGGAEGALVRQGPDGRGGQVRHLATITNTAALGGKRPGALLPGSAPASKQRKQVADQVRAGPGGAKQLKLSSFFGGGGSKAVR